MSSEVTRYAGNYIRVTTEEKDGNTYERAYLRNGVSVIVESAPGVLRFPYGSNWKSPNPLPLVVCGHLEEDEEPLTAAQRELAEELGATAAHWTHYMTSTWRGTVTKTQEYFVARDLAQGKAHPEADEHITGYVDMTHAEVYEAVLGLKFGTNENAFALLKYITESSQ